MSAWIVAGRAIAPAALLILSGCQTTARDAPLHAVPHPARFLLTFDDKLSLDRVNQMIGVFRFRDDPLELLTLSACDTAAGDDRAALGLAGIAIKAGARSALATLWNINDQATVGLVLDFYRELKNPAISRVGALQRAQLKLIENPRYEHPGYWSAFLMINNWL